MLAALDHAGDRPPAGSSQNETRRWSERFAHACAAAIAGEVRAGPLAGRRIRPEGMGSGTEPLTPLGGTYRKRIDVTVSDPMLGLELGFSLKGLNFRDAASGSFDKNLTGRLYELGDEMRVVHEHLPHAFMVGIFFLPLESCADKSDAAASSFARTVLQLRERTGRLDALMTGQAARCDAGFVGLYAHATDALAQRGVVRLLDVREHPPRRGRPQVAKTLSLSAAVERAVASATHSEQADWGESEPEMEP